MDYFLNSRFRYIPLGLLERMPPKLNWRTPAFYGRNELETLLGSPYSKDWISLSEMLLGKAPEDLNFVPKHKSYAWQTSETNNQ
jgi:tRNA-dihydrouridine synthase 3